jgi:hypothetical protein
MQFEDLKRHLAPYRIYARRKTTINHAFAAAIAPCDGFVKETVIEALRLLEQDPERELKCVYCDDPAETWDHVFATVKDSVFSGAGHRIGNLLPCCKQCNSRKGNRSWDAYIISREAPGPLRELRIERVRRYLSRLFVADMLPASLPEYARFMEIRDEILRLMREADSLANAIRQKMKGAKSDECVKDAQSAPSQKSEGPG